MDFRITKEQARRFLLLKHGLLGKYKYSSAEDIVKIIEKIGCIQYDPIDIVGKNAELVLNSRFQSFKKEYLSRELYEERTLIDYWDKNMSIILVSDYKFFKNVKDKFKANIKGIEEVEKLAPIVLERLAEAEFLSSKDIELGGKMDWYWFTARKSKAVLEALFHQGRAVIHHRKNTNRYFSLPDKLLSKEEYLDYEFPSDTEYFSFRILRRIKGVGLLGPSGSYAYIGIDDLSQNIKKTIFEKLYSDEKIIKVNIEGLNLPYYLVVEDLEYLKQAISEEEFEERLEFIAPLDNLIWDREFIKKLFDFDYIWEIYFPKEKRVYGYYCLPILYGTKFIGRIEAIANKKAGVLEVKNIYLEPGVKKTKKLEEKMNKALKKLMNFNNLTNIIYEE